ncbi:hypothetical protein F511_31592 [Dorcoceras hygrometricum]|uniref:Acyl-CoA dehydrogenase-related protein n=1 Tax=Dorcoceras hygrometricum TaxID=472368 RepID=A0A2Z7AFT7_9LAMI|nr:hypothetical protein F511_31592 [Dorcoceras hygrometricum]
MPLFDLQDVRIAIGSLATLDLPMVVDLIGIYGLKGPYCTLTTTDWFLQALSVIPRGSWGDVARRFTMIRWADSKQTLAAPLFSSPAAAAAAVFAVFAGKLVSAQLDVENPFVLISSGLLVQSDEGVSDLVVDRIGVTTAIYREESELLIITLDSKQTLAAPLFSSPAAAAAAVFAVFAGKLVSAQLDVENPFVLISSGLLVQSDEGVSDLVVDRIGVTTAIYREESGS